MSRAPVAPSARVVEVASPLLTTKELGTYLKCSPATAEKWRSLKKGPPWVLTAYGPRYRISDVERWRAETERAGGVMESRRRQSFKGRQPEVGAQPETSQAVAALDSSEVPA